MVLEVVHITYNDSNKRQMWWFTAHGWVSHWLPVAHYITYCWVSTGLLHVVQWLPGRLVQSPWKRVFIVCCCSSHAWDQGGSPLGHGGCAGKVTQSVKDGHQASFSVTVPHFTLHYGPYTVFYHADVFHHWSLGKLNYSMYRFRVNNKGKLFQSKNLNNKYKLFCLNFVPFYGLKLVAYQDTVKQIYWTDTYGWPVDLYVGSWSGLTFLPLAQFPLPLCLQLSGFTEQASDWLTPP